MIPFTILLTALIRYLLDKDNVSYNDAMEDNRTYIISSIIIILILPYITYLTLSSFTFYPPNPELAYIKSSVKAEDKNPELEKIEDKADILRAKFSNPKDITLNELEKLLNDAVDLTKSFTLIISQQNEEINYLNSEVKKTNKNAKKAIEHAAQLEGISDEMIEGLKRILTEDANKSARNSLILGIIFSIPSGIIASLVFKKLFE
ncbi:MAG: hypothetical protein AB4063_03820 [Crocosphaera sp.]